MKKIVTALAIIMVVGVLGYLGMKGQHHFEHHSVMEEVNAHRVHIEDGALTSLPLTIDTTGFLKVHAELKGVHPFYTEMRREDIISFPCSNCHNRPLGQLQSKEGGKSNAHWDIKLHHAVGDIMNCLTCHSGTNMNDLVSISGEPISLDQSYLMCAQCHTTQYRDWQGGAHGKSISGWQPPRIVKTCVSCHNPHDPNIKPRWPSRL